MLLVLDVLDVLHVGRRCVRAMRQQTVRVTTHLPKMAINRPSCAQCGQTDVALPLLVQLGRM